MAKTATKTKPRGSKKPAKKAVARKPAKKKVSKKAKASSSRKSPGKAKKSAQPTARKTKARKTKARKSKVAAKKGAQKKTTRKAVPKKGARRAAPKAAKKKPAKQKPARVARPKTPKKKAPPRAPAGAKKAAMRVPKKIRVAPRPSQPSPPTPEEKARLKAAQAQRESEDRQAQIYGKAVKYFNSKKYQRALKLLKQVAAGPHPSLRHRAGVYVEICRQRIRPSKVKLKTADEYYNYGVQLVNERRLDEAESQFRHALRMQPKGAHIHLAAAVLGALAGDIEKTYKSLKKAIDLDPRSRVLALNDADLSPVLSEPSIAKLLHGSSS